MWGRARETDSGWVGAGPDDDLDQRLASEESSFDLSQPHVRTLLGPVVPAALGPTLVGEPFDLAAETLRLPAAGVGLEDALLAELEDAYAAGVRTVVALCRTEHARFLLTWLASRAPVHLVAVASPEMAVEGDGLPFGAVVLDLDASPSANQSTLDAVISVHRERALPVMVRSRDSRKALDVTNALLLGGIDAGHLWVGGCEWDDDPAEPLAVLETGISAAFDRVLGAIDGTDDGGQRGGYAGLIGQVIRYGYAGRILLGSGVAGGGELRVGGGPGMAAVLERFPLMLMDVGLQAMDIRQVVIDTPARLLTIRPEER